MTVKAFVNLSTRQKFFFIYKLFSAQYPICLFFFLKSYKISLPVAEDAALAVAEVDAADVAGEVGGSQEHAAVGAGAHTVRVRSGHVVV